MKSKKNKEETNKRRQERNWPEGIFIIKTILK